MQRGYKVKIYPTRTQEQVLLNHVGACRFVYNYFLARKKDEYLKTGKNLTYNMLSKELTILRKETEWMQQVQFQPLQQSLRNLDVAYNRFFRKQAMFPKFHKKNGKQTMKKVGGWSVSDNRLSIMDGVSVRFRGTFPKERQGTLTISRDTCGSWWASTIGEEKRKQPKLKGAIGIDLGLDHLAVTSDGDKFDNPHALRGLLRRLRFASKALSRTKKMSRTRCKRRLALARVYRRVEAVRKNGLHHVSKAIVGKNHAMIAVEDLNIKGMLKNRKLSRAIADAGWKELLRQITYKQEWAGGMFIKIDRFFPSSKTCSDCGFVLDTLPLSIRNWSCPKCGKAHDRDVNAARMILKQAGEQLELERKTDGSRKARVSTSLKVGCLQG